MGQCAAWAGFHHGDIGPQKITRAPKNSGNGASWEVKFNCTCKEILLLKGKKLSGYQAYFWFSSRIAIPQAPPPPLISRAVLKTSTLLARIALLLSFTCSTSTPVLQPFPPQLPAVLRFLSPDPCDTKERESPHLRTSVFWPCQRLLEHGFHGHL